MCRGCFSSCKYSATCLSESWRPNQVFHQNRNGMSTISHAVRKKSSRFPVDIRGRGLVGGLVLASDEDCAVASGRTGMGSRKYSRKRVSQPLLHHVCIEHAVLLQIVRDGVLGEKRR